MIRDLEKIMREAGQLAIKMRRDGLTRISKDSVDFATEADIAAEDLILSKLAPLLPGVEMVGEESADFENSEVPANCVTIDPIDGTWNFSKGLPDWGSILCVLENGKPQVGCIFLPEKDLFFSAEAGKGTFCNHQRITSLNPTESLASSLINLDIYHGFNAQKLRKYYQPLIDHSLGCRSLLATVAGTAELLQGLTVAYSNPDGAKIWDLAAPALLVQEAGGSTYSFKRKSEAWTDWNAGELFASNQAVMNKIKDILGTSSFV